MRLECICPVANLDLVPESMCACYLLFSVPMRTWIIELLLSYDRLVQVVHMAERLSIQWSLIS